MAWKRWSSWLFVSTPPAADFGAGVGEGVGEGVAHAGELFAGEFNAGLEGFEDESIERAVGVCPGRSAGRGCGGGRRHP